MERKRESGAIARQRRPDAVRSPATPAGLAGPSDEELRRLEAGLARIDWSIPDGVEADAIEKRYFYEAGRRPLLNRTEEVALSHLYRAGLSARHRLSEGRVAEGERESLERRVADGDHAYDHLVGANMRLVIAVARRFQGRGLELLDLIQEGNIGLLEAIQRFDPERGFKLSTYATWWIHKSILRAIANTGTVIRVPVHRSQRLWMAQREAREQSERTGAEVSLAAAARSLGLGVDAVDEVLYDASITGATYPLDAPLGDDEEYTLYRLVNDPSSVDTQASLATAEIRRTLQEMLPKLTEREQLVLTLRYGLDDGEVLTLEELANKLGVTKQRVLQIEEHAIKRLGRDRRWRKISLA